MDEHLHDDLIDQIRKSSSLINGVVGTEKCLVRKMGMNYIVDLHVIVDGKLSVVEGHSIAHSVKDKLKIDLPEVTDILIHIEPDSE
jgi:divalent metal cation (Fe/Co/Zn/Cd) transporter